MYLLDTVAISETSKPELDPGMRDFLLSISEPSLFISVVSIGEMEFGWRKLPIGRRRDALQEWSSRTEKEFSGRVLGVDSSVAAIWGEIRAVTRQSGYNISLPDLLIAATAIQHDLTVVTRNTRDFLPTGCKTLNPWEQSF